MRVLIVGSKFVHPCHLFKILENAKAEGQNSERTCFERTSLNLR